MSGEESSTIFRYLMGAPSYNGHTVAYVDLALVARISPAQVPELLAPVEEFMAERGFPSLAALVVFASDGSCSLHENAEAERERLKTWRRALKVKDVYSLAADFDGVIEVQS